MQSFPGKATKDQDLDPEPFQAWCPYCLQWRYVVWESKRENDDGVLTWVSTGRCKACGQTCVAGWGYVSKRQASLF